MYSWIILTINKFKAPCRVDIPQFSREVPCDAGVLPRFQPSIERCSGALDVTMAAKIPGCLRMLWLIAVRTVCIAIGNADLIFNRLEPDAQFLQGPR
jgi:hypothetical protein